MKKALTATCVLALCFPLPAWANRVHDVSFQVQAEHAVIAVSADEQFESPRVRSERGRLRVWFPGITDRGKLTIEGDGAAIGKIALRPNGAKTALLEVELRDDATLPKNAVSAEADGQRFYLRIARSALPTLAVEVDGDDIPVAGDESTTVEVTTSSALDAAGRADGEKGAQEASTAMSDGLGLQRNVQAATAGSRPLSELATARGPMDEQGDGSAMMLWAMSALAAALGGGYLYLKKVKRSASGDDAYAEIQVLGSRRIGPKQQLLLIRALGEDHLLLVNGDKAEHLSSVPTHGHAAQMQHQSDTQANAAPVPAMLAPRPSRPDPEQARREPAEEDLADLMAAASKRSDSVAVERSVDGESRSNGTKSSFEKDVVGLMRKMSGQEDKPSPLQTSPAVQGLLRLRREVG